MKRPKIITELPGPKARELLKRDSKYISPSYTRAYPAVIEKGEGVWVKDVDGNVFLDFSAGIAVLNTGHCHPEIVKAIKDQAQTFITLIRLNLLKNLLKSFRVAKIKGSSLVILEPRLWSVQ